MESHLHPDHENPTQADKILERLQRTPGEWVPMPELWEVSGAFAVHSRISELRARGHAIEVKVVGSRPRCSAYRIIQEVPTFSVPSLIALAAAAITLALILSTPACTSRQAQPNPFHDAGTTEIYFDSATGKWTTGGQ